MAASAVAATFSSVAITNCCDVAWRYKKITDHGGEAEVEIDTAGFKILMFVLVDMELFIHHFSR